MVCGLRLTLEDCGPVLDQMLARPRGADEIDERTLCSVRSSPPSPITLTCDVGVRSIHVHVALARYWIGFDRAGWSHIASISIRWACVASRMDRHPTRRSTVII